jgi:hypothetical protein
MAMRILLKRSFYCVEGTSDSRNGQATLQPELFDQQKSPPVVSQQERSVHGR